MVKKGYTLLFIILIVNSAFCGTTGKIFGKITDQTTSQPLTGVNIEIRDYALGAASDIDGIFFILNVPVGRQSVIASFIGYKSLEYEDVLIEADRTIVVDFVLSEDILDIGETIIILAERERIKKDLTMSSQHVSKEEIEVLPVTTFEDVALLQAGAVGTNFRGGRQGEVLPVIDGISVKNPFSQYGATYVNRGETYLQTNFLLPKTAIEQMEVLTGGFNAEYGNAQSAFINIITQSGGPKHTGRLTFRTSAAGHSKERYWYKDKQGQWIYERDKFLEEFLIIAQPPDSLLAMGVRAPSVKNALSTENLETYMTDDYAYKEFELSLSGPIPFKQGKMRYSLNTEMDDNDVSQISYWGPQFRGSVQGKINYRITPKHRLQLSGLGSWINSHSIGHREAKFPGGYLPGIGTMPPKVDSEERDFNRNFMGNLKWSHTISNRTFYDVQMGVTYNGFDRKTRDWNDRDGDGDFDEFLKWEKIKMPEDPSDPNTGWTEDWGYTTDDTKYFWVDSHSPSGNSGQWRWGVPGISDWDQVWVLNRNYYTYDKEWRYLTGTQNEQELKPYPITGQPEGFIFPIIPDSYFQYYGDGNLYYEADNINYLFKTDFSSQINKSNLLKTGIHFTLSQLQMLRYNFGDESSYYFENYEVNPIDFSIYIQDKMEFEGLIVNAGIRYDYFYSGDDVPYPSDFNIPVDLSKHPDDDDYIINPIKAKPFHSISPRLGMSHPITENTVLHFAYGHFYQRPEYRFWFNNLKFDLERGPGYMGNPSLKPEKTISYEVGVKHNFQQWLFGLNVFYRDIFNLTDNIRIGERPLYNYRIMVNRDWADVRGAELTVRKFLSSYFGGSLNYTYMVAKGNASDPWNISENQTGAQEPFYLDWDQRHTFNINANFILPENWGPKMGMFYPLANWSINLLHTHNSGKPYSLPRRDIKDDLNSGRFEATMQTDLKVIKRFAITDRVKARFLLEGYNIFNQKNLIYPFDIELWLRNGDAEGNGFFRPSVWEPRRYFRLGLGFEF